MAPLQVFVSYSHKDKRALERLQTHLAPLKRQLAIDVWDDTRLQGGDAWLPEIEQALEADNQPEIGQAAKIP